MQFGACTHGEPSASDAGQGETSRVGTRAQHQEGSLASRRKELKSEPELKSQEHLLEKE